VSQDRVRAVEAEEGVGRVVAHHNGVPDNAGTGGEASVSGIGHPVDDAAVRATVVAADREGGPAQQRETR
jgi:hypothetical protein